MRTFHGVELLRGVDVAMNILRTQLDWACIRAPHRFGMHCVTCSSGRFGVAEIFQLPKIVFSRRARV